MTSRERFEEWYSINAFDYARDPIGSRECGLKWASWQAAEARAVKRCAEIAANLASHYRAVYKGRTGDRCQWHAHHTDGLCDGAGEVETAIRAEFPEVFK